MTIPTACQRLGRPSSDSNSICWRGAYSPPGAQFPDPDDERHPRQVGAVVGDPVGAMPVRNVGLLEVLPLDVESVEARLRLRPATR